MSRLLYKFIACSDIHAKTWTSGGETKIPEPLKAYASELLNDGKLAAVISCGDFCINAYGIESGNDGSLSLISWFMGLREQTGKTVLMCAGNHSSYNYYGYGSAKTGIDAWKGLLGYQPYTGEYNGAAYTDDYIQIREIEGDLFVSISDQRGTAAENENYNNDTIVHALDLIDKAIEAGQRVFVFTHYPFCSMYNTETQTVSKNTTDFSVNRFAPRVCHGSGGPTLVLNDNYPVPQSYEAKKFLGKLALRKVIWFSGHTHNFWDISHPDGIVLYNENATTGENYQIEANTNYKMVFPYAKVCRNGTNGAYMVNLPSVRFNLQDAMVYVYNDKVVIRERQYGGNTYVQTVIPGAYATGESLIPGAKQSAVTGDNAKGTMPAPDMSGTGTTVLADTWVEITDRNGVYYDHTVEIYGTGTDEPDEPEEPDEPDDPPTPPGGSGLLSVPLRLADGTKITRYEELPESIKARLENGAKLWYMANGVRHEITWQQAAQLDGYVLVDAETNIIIDADGYALVVAS